ncbi:unannotated protein [freshwater metagenome]|uniref:Unannotated protein n=1 Tax=freshwater metagenome TaxID=449393 RepID=A0A6J7TVX5_9ZZZZ
MTRATELLLLVNGTLHQWSRPLLLVRLISGQSHEVSTAFTDSWMVKQISSTLNLLQTITLLMRRAQQKRDTTFQKILLIKLFASFLITKVFDPTVRFLDTLHLVQPMRLTRLLLRTWRNIVASLTKVGTLFASVGLKSKLQRVLFLQTQCCRRATRAYSRGKTYQTMKSALLLVCKKHLRHSLITLTTRLVVSLKACAK